MTTDELPDWNTLLSKNIDEYATYSQNVAELARFAVLCPQGVHLARIEIDRTNIGLYRGTPETVMLWFIADKQEQPKINKELADKFKTMHDRIQREGHIVFKYEIGYRLEGQPGVVKIAGKSLHHDEALPGMYLRVSVNKE